MENLTLNVEGEQKNLEIRMGDALPVRELTPLVLTGCAIDSPLRFLEKRVAGIDQLNAYLIVNREDLSLTLKVNEHSYFKDFIQGVLKLSPEFNHMKINTYDYITPLQMSEMIKMNRTLFENHTQAMELVTQLRQFKAKIEKDVERNVDLNKGDRKLSVVQSVETNLPGKFNLILPIFVGIQKQTIEVETYFNPDDLTCCLVSPQANDAMQEIKDKEIDRQIVQIREVAPNLLIIEE